MNLHNTHEDSYLTFVLVSSFPNCLPLITCLEMQHKASWSLSIVTRGLRSGRVPASSAMLPDSLCWEELLALTYSLYIQVSCLSSGFAVLMFIGIVLFCRWKKLF